MIAFVFPRRPRVTRQLQVSSALQVAEKYQSVNTSPFGGALFISIANDNVTKDAWPIAQNRTARSAESSTSRAPLHLHDTAAR